jgi:hypothetical protein
MVWWSGIRAKARTAWVGGKIEVMTMVFFKAVWRGSLLERDCVDAVFTLGAAGVEAEVAI